MYKCIGEFLISLLGWQMPLRSAEMTWQMIALRLCLFVSCLRQAYWAVFLCLIDIRPIFTASTTINFLILSEF